MRQNGSCLEFLFFLLTLAIGTLLYFIAMLLEERGRPVGIAAMVCYFIGITYMIAVITRPYPQVARRELPEELPPAEMAEVLLGEVWDE